MMLKIILSAAALLATFVFMKPKNNPELAGPIALPSSVTTPDNNPVELGKVHWLRDLDAGQAEAKRSGKPILILFQEVPGCSNCTRYGNSTLSHPLIVEAIETYFVPVCIYNNKGGKDADALKRFQEPAWNNPVVRIVRADYQDVVLRMPNFNSPFQLVNGMRRALEQTGAPVPVYMNLLEAELSAREAGLELATFSMYCFWSGEGAFGSIPGVVETEPGYQDGKEVVRVWYDPVSIKKSELEAMSKPKGVSACARNEGFRTDSQPKYYLSQTPYRFVPMTTLQACRINSWIGKGGSPDEWLSPRQLALLKKIQENPGKKWQSMIGEKDLAGAWEQVEKV
ncbi:MAG: thioredoxin family protein [Saprospiraceae bacterium]|nr:thioredoxin family protein [Saprospiraceae bacterium]